METHEITFTGKSGITIVIYRYGQNDYSVWFTDDPDDDSSGCSTRGSLEAIIYEILKSNEL